MAARVYSYLTIYQGPRAGANYLLDPAGETRLGRGTECQVVVNDPLCSRVHVVIAHDGDGWQLRDAGSRNGTYAAGERVHELLLTDGTRFRIGGTDFSFRQSTSPPPLVSSSDTSFTQTLVKDARVGSFDPVGLAVAAIQNPEQAQDLLLLHQLSVQLLGTNESQAILRAGLELLRRRTEASVVGFLWVSDDGALEPKLVVPDHAAERVDLSDELTRLVCQEQRAIWVTNQQAAGVGDTLQHFADALCAPLVHQDRVLGAMHVYLEKGRFRPSHFEFAVALANLVAVALARARHEASLQTHFDQLRLATPGYDELVGESPPMRDLKSKIARLAQARGSVLIAGESGTGKELVARAVHRASPRADRPLLAVNCAAIPSELMESQLFGHKAGAFTGADRDHVGFFQQADLGTLFLDEVGELTLAGQSKLLRILEGHPFLPVGSTHEVKVDVRVIAATNRDLLGYVREKKFREDLYYRLSVFELRVPPLRERAGDVERLVDYFLDHFRRLHGRPGLRLAPAARDKLLAYHWPGNVRQLRNVMDSATVLAGGQAIEPADLALREAGGSPFDTLRIEDWEQRLIAEALHRTDGNVHEAAKLLGIGRATLYRKLEQYGIGREGS